VSDLGQWNRIMASVLFCCLTCLCLICVILKSAKNGRITGTFVCKIFHFRNFWMHFVFSFFFRDVQSGLLLVIDWTSGVRNPVQPLKCSPSPVLLDWLLGPQPTFYPMGAENRVTGAWELTTHFCPFSVLRLRSALLPLPQELTPSWHDIVSRGTLILLLCPVFWC
jgi:hypothetical protein